MWTRREPSQCNHLFAVAEVQPELNIMLENTGKYKAHRAPGTDLACLAHNQYYKSCAVVASGGTKLSKFAIFRIPRDRFRMQRDGRAGGASEAVVAAFHGHTEEAKKGQSQGCCSMDNKMNA